MIADDPRRCPYEPMDVGDARPFVLRAFRSFGHRAVRVGAPRTDKRLAVIVPYRHRAEHLRQFLPSMTEHLDEAGIEGRIFVVQQADRGLFNKGLLMNAGFQLAGSEFDYFCFHDVDHLPVTAGYEYVEHPVSLANALAEGHAGYFGGVLLMTREHFELVNGFGNEYWHWGWEDEDMRVRCLISGLTPLVYPAADYVRLAHPPSVTRTPDGVYHDSRKVLSRLYATERRSIRAFLDFAKGRTRLEDNGLNTARYAHLGTVETDSHTRFDVTPRAESIH